VPSPTMTPAAGSPLARGRLHACAQELGSLDSASVIVRPSDRVKTDLMIDALDLIAAVELHRREGRWPAASLVRMFTAGPLVLYHYGALARAQALCEHALVLYSALFEATGSFNWVATGLQPYINLARLWAARGCTERAVDVYAGLVQLAASTPARGPAWLEAAPREQLLAWLPGVRRRLLDAALMDTLKAFLVVERYEDALVFLDRIDRDPMFDTPPQRDVSREGRVRALRGLRRDEEALAVLSDLLAPMSDGATVFGLQVLASDLHRACGRRVHARRVLHAAERTFETGEHDRDSAPSRRTRYVAALAWCALDEPEQAAARARDLLQLARNASDEVEVLKALTLLCDASAGGATSVHELESAASQTGYQIERGVALLHLARAGDAARRSARLLESRRTFCALEMSRRSWWIDRVDEEMRRSAVADDRRTPAAASSGQAEIATQMLRLYETLMSVEADELFARGAAPS
jgi:hypothetical protein